MNVVVVASAADAAVIVADAVTDLLGRQADAVVGLAAGSSPLLAYRLLRERHVPLAGATVVLLDEYFGIGPTHPASFRRQMQVQLTDELHLPEDQLLVLDGLSTDPAVTCARFEDAIVQRGGVQFQLLGIGRNGHIAFNEPGAPRSSRTRLVELSETTRTDSAPAFGSLEAVPREALTQGIATILDARTLVLLATGAAKAPAVKAAVEGPVTESLPASALQGHADVTFVLDREAASLLTGAAR